MSTNTAEILAAKLETVLREIRAEATVGGYSECCGCTRDIHVVITAPDGSEHTVRIDQP